MVCAVHAQGRACPVIAKIAYMAQFARQAGVADLSPPPKPDRQLDTVSQFTPADQIERPIQLLMQHWG